MARALQVSFGTLRRAVDERVHEHILARRQRKGKGSFVALHGNDRFLLQFFHIGPRSDCRFSDLPPLPEFPMVKCLEFERERANESVAGALRIKTGDPVIRFDNRLSLAGRAVAHDNITILALMFRA